jgi:hypothetical protein
MVQVSLTLLLDTLQKFLRQAIVLDWCISKIMRQKI